MKTANCRTPGKAAVAANAVTAERTLSASEAVTRTGSDIVSDAALAHCAPKVTAAAFGTSPKPDLATPAPARTCKPHQRYFHTAVSFSVMVQSFGCMIL